MTALAGEALVIYRDNLGTEWLVEEVARHETGRREGAATVTLCFSHGRDERIARACPADWPARILTEGDRWFARAVRARPSGSQKLVD